MKKILFNLFFAIFIMFFLINLVFILLLNDRNIISFGSNSIVFSDAKYSSNGINRGDLVLISNDKFSSLKQGMNISFLYDGKVLFGTITDIGRLRSSQISANVSLDNNNKSYYVEEGDYLGYVSDFKIPFIGYLFKFSVSYIGLSLLTILAVIFSAIKIYVFSNNKSKNSYTYEIEYNDLENNELVNKNDNKQDDKTNDEEIKDNSLNDGIIASNNIDKDINIVSDDVSNELENKDDKLNSDDHSEDELEVF